jgi:hypothetical protein
VHSIEKCFQEILNLPAKLQKNSWFAIVRVGKTTTFAAITFHQKLLEI